MFLGDVDTDRLVGRSEHALVTAGQRKINVLWEYTQAAIAIIVVLANMGVSIHIGLCHGSTDFSMPPVLSNTLFLVVGFYFSRTNHSNIGGVGEKKVTEYHGR